MTPHWRGRASRELCTGSADARSSPSPALLLAGAFAGVALDGAVVFTRDRLNSVFYGHPASVRERAEDGTSTEPRIEPPSVPNEHLESQARHCLLGIWASFIAIVAGCRAPPRRPWACRTSRAVQHSASGCNASPSASHEI